MKNKKDSKPQRHGGTEPESVTVWKSLSQAEKLEMARAIEIILNLRAGERACCYCGCTDSKACKGGCSWIIKHKFTPTGICSACLGSMMKEVDNL